MDDFVPDDSLQLQLPVPEAKTDPDSEQTPAVAAPEKRKRSKKRSKEDEAKDQPTAPVVAPTAIELIKCDEENNESKEEAPKKRKKRSKKSKTQESAADKIELPFNVNAPVFSPIEVADEEKERAEKPATQVPVQSGTEFKKEGLESTQSEAMPEKNPLPTSDSHSLFDTKKSLVTEEVFV